MQTRVAPRVAQTPGKGRERSDWDGMTYSDEPLVMNGLTQ